MRRPGMYVERVYLGAQAGYDLSSKMRRQRMWLGHWEKHELWMIAALAAGVFALLLFFYTVRHIKYGNVHLSEAVQGGYGLSEEKTEASAAMPETDDTAVVPMEETETSKIPVEGDLIPKAPGELVVALDPGHGGIDEGCSREGIFEKDVNLQIAFLVEARLLELGYRVVLTRNTDEGLSLEERVETARRNQADLYVSIHQNASEEPSVEGIEVLYSTENAGEESRHAAELIRKYAAQETEAVSRELLEEEGLYVIRECTMPSCLVETGFLSNRQEREKLTDSEYQGKIASGIASAIDLYFHPKTMYLTFDDGPSKETTLAVLDILRKRNIHATFFLVGENVERYPEIARRIVEEGHTIGIHCYSHEYRTLYAGTDSYLADFQKAFDVVEAATGVEAKLVRFPGGSINSYNEKVYQEIAQAMTEQGFVYFDWNASLEDASSHQERETLLENAVSSTLGRKKVVMLAHDTVKETAQCLEELLDQFPEYQMEPLTEEVEPIQF